VRALNRLYDAEGCAFRAEEVAGGFQLRSRAQFAPWLRRLDQSVAEVRLSAPAMETLAVVAYRQPVLRVEIEAIRGVQCGEILRQLIERDLVRIAGRSEELGRPLLYGTTKRFLELFGLRNLDALPRARAVQLRPQEETAESLTADATVGNQATASETNAPDEAQEETNVKILSKTETAGEELMNDQAVATAIEPQRNQVEDDDLSSDDLEEDDNEEEYEDDFDDYDYDEDELDEEDEEEDDYDEELWEEVDDEEEEEEEDEEYDEDWDEEDWDDEVEDDTDEED
jgi:segregation and condensation protein B